MSTKKPAAKSNSQKKPVAAAKKAPAKPAPKKAVAAKPKKVAAKAAPAKKAAAKPAVSKSVAKAEPAKPKKAQVKKPVKHGKKPPAKPAKRQQIRITKQPRPQIEQAGTEFNNTSQSFAFTFAEQMKRAQRDENSKAEAERESRAIRLSRRPTMRTKGGSDPLKFSAADLKEFRKRLIMMRQAVLGQAASLRNIALEQTEERGSEEEDGSDAFLRLQNLSQVDSQNRVIQMIDEALHRIADGTYGVCNVCGQLIRKPRLINLPFVQTCMECQVEMEKGQ